MVHLYGQPVRAGHVRPISTRCVDGGYVQQIESK